MKLKVTLVSPYQFGMLPFQQPIFDRWKSLGVNCQNHFSVPRFLHYIIYHYNVIFSFYKFLGRKKTKLLFVSGTHPDIMLFPYTYTNEIIPIIWDCWPDYSEHMRKIFETCNINIAFFTSKQVTLQFQKIFPKKKIYYLPEAINTTLYYQGGPLQTRTIDILEYGRPNNKIHDQLLHLLCYNHIYNEEGKHLFKDFDDLAKAISNSKIVICYPRSVTDPQIAKGIETLTQRYWECMYSGTLIVGKAPQELVDLVGYNPVIECEFDNILQIVQLVLENIKDYQTLADKNRAFAIDNGDWMNRLNCVRSILLENDYSI